MAKSSDILPMPVDLVIRHPAMAVAGNIVFSAVTCLAQAYWLGGCKPLPAETHDRMVLARTNSPAWLRHGAAIEEALSAILPILQRAREARLAEIEERRARQARGYARQAAEGRAPHLSPHHISKRRKRHAASTADVIAHAALEAAGITDRRMSAAEMAGSAIIASRAARVDLSGVAGIGHGEPPTVDTATAPHPAAPQHPAKPKTGMRETTKR